MCISKTRGIDTVRTFMEDIPGGPSKGVVLFSTMGSGRCRRVVSCLYGRTSTRRCMMALVSKSHTASTRVLNRLFQGCARRPIAIVRSIGRTVRCMLQVRKEEAMCYLNSLCLAKVVGRVVRRSLDKYKRI